MPGDLVANRQGAPYSVTTTGQFWMLGVVLALVMGGTQSVSRYLMGQMTPPVSKSGEFFGFFNLKSRPGDQHGGADLVF